MRAVTKRTIKKVNQTPGKIMSQDFQYMIIFMSHG